MEKAEPIPFKIESSSTPKVEVRKSFIRTTRKGEEKRKLDVSPPDTVISISETIFQTSNGSIPEDTTTTQQYIYEYIRQFAELTRDENAIFKEYLEQFHELPRISIKEGIQDTHEQFAHRFSVYHNMETEKFHIGDSNIEFYGPDVKIKNVKYKGTPGLYELLFKNHPIGYNKPDEKEYVDILKRTNALYTHHDPKFPLQRATKVVKEKYRKVIETYSRRPRPGSAPTIQTRSTLRKQGGKMYLLNFNKYPIEYKYFVNYNELIDRWKLLEASRKAGNEANNNEIISTVEELREGRIIK